MQPTTRSATQTGGLKPAVAAIAVCASVNGHAQAVIVAPEAVQARHSKPS